MNNYDKAIELLELYNTLQESSSHPKRDAGGKSNKHIQEQRRKSENYKDRLEAFKKKYNFKPDKEGSTHGTITWRGEKINVNITDNSCIAVPAVDTENLKFGDFPIYTSNTMLCNFKNGEINIDPIMFKLKKEKERNIIIDHEVGHKKFHASKDGKLNEEYVNSLVSNTLTSLTNNRKIANLLAGSITKKLIKRNIENVNTKDIRTEIRKEAIKELKRYEKTNPHSIYSEYEADMYAMNKNNASPKKLEKSLNNYAKVYTDSIYGNNKKDAEYMKNIHEDNITRRKVQEKKKVENIRKNKIYNESTIVECIAILDNINQNRIMNENFE